MQSQTDDGIAFAQSLACAQWLQSLVVGGTRVIVPEMLTTNDKALDGDMILAAQTMMLSASDAVIATVGHLSRFAPAALWQNITIG